MNIIISDFLKSCKKQYEEFEKFDHQKGYLFGENYEISIAASYSQNYLTNIDLNIFIENFSSIFHKNRAEEISHLFEKIEQVRASKEFLKEIQKIAHEGYSKNLEIYNSNLDRLRKYHDLLFDKYAGHQQGVSGSISLISGIFDVFKKWKDNGADFTVNSTCTQIINPLYELSVLERYNNQFSAKVVELCLPCRVAFNNMKLSEDLLKSSVRESLEIHKKTYLEGTRVTKNW